MLLEFDYINHRGEPHRYRVRPEKLVFEEYIEDLGRHWMVDAKVVSRDGVARPGARYFILSEMNNVREVPDEAT